MGFEINMKSMLLAVLALMCGTLFVIFGGVLAVLVTLLGSVAALVTVLVFWLSGKRRSAGRLLAFWGGYLAFYVVVSTGIAVFGPRFENPKPIGEEVCADTGCFAVDKVDKTTAGPTIAYTLFWHLASTDSQQTKRFPGKGLELFMFDERGRTFKLPQDANPNPLDLLLPAGQTVRQSITFNVPADARELFLTAKYRPFTYQSLFPGELSLVPHRPAAMIRIQ